MISRRIVILRNEKSGESAARGPWAALPPPHDCREKVRPDTGREAGLGHAGGRAMHGAVAE